MLRADAVDAPLRWSRYRRAPLIFVLYFVAASCSNSSSGGGVTPTSTVLQQYQLDAALVIAPIVQPVRASTGLASGMLSSTDVTTITSFDSHFSQVGILVAHDGRGIAPFLYQRSSGTTSIIGLTQIALGLCAMHPWVSSLEAERREDLLNHIAGDQRLSELESTIATILATAPTGMLDDGADPTIAQLVHSLVLSMLGRPHTFGSDPCNSSTGCGTPSAANGFEVQPGINGSALIVNPRAIFYGYVLRTDSGGVAFGLMRPKHGLLSPCWPPFTLPTVECRPILENVTTTIEADSWGLSIDAGTAAGRGTLANFFYVMLHTLEYWNPFLFWLPAEEMAASVVEFETQEALGVGTEAVWEDFLANVYTEYTTPSELLRNVADWLNDDVVSYSGQGTRPTNYQWLYEFLWHRPAPSASVDALSRFVEFAGHLAKALDLNDAIPLYYDAITTLVDPPVEFCAHNSDGLVTITCTPPYSVTPTFSYEPLTIDVQEAVLFDASPSIIKGQVPSLPVYEWVFDDFDDNATPDIVTTSIEPVHHVFAGPGVHVVTLRIRIGSHVFSSFRHVLVGDAPQAQLCVVPDGPVTRSYAIGGSVPRDEVRTITNCGDVDSILMWQASEEPSVPWLIESPQSGVLAPGNGAQLRLSFEPNGLAPGTYATVLHLTSGASTATLDATTIVQLSVTEQPSTCLDDFGEPNNSCGSATQITPTVAVVALICTSSDIDYYRFTLDEPGILTTTLIPPHNPCIDYDLRTYSPCGTLLGQGTTDGCGTETTVEDIPAAGNAYLAVVGSTNSWSGSSPYTLMVSFQQTAIDQFEPNDTCAQGAGIASTDELSATIGSPTDVDWYEFELPDPKVVTVRLTSPQSPCLNYEARLYQGCGTLIETDFEPACSQELLSAGYQLAGIYRVKVSGVSGAWNPTAEYKLQVKVEDSVNDSYEPNDTCSTATATAAGATVQALIGSPTDVDWFSFSLSATHSVTVRLTPPQSPCINYDVRLFRGCSTQIGYSPSSGCGVETIHASNQPVGTYYVKITGTPLSWSPSATYALQLTVQ